MASGTLYLRPSADIYVEHYFFMSGAVDYHAYMCINEEVSDDAGSYIQVHTIGVTEETSKFKLSNATTLTGKPFIVTAVNIMGDPSAISSTSGTHRNRFSLEINGVETEAYLVESNKNFDISVSAPGVIDAINEFIATKGVLPDINIVITSYAYEDTSSSKGGRVNSGVSQVYVAIHYEEITDIGIHHKVNGTWVAATAAYQKQNGSWVEITEAEAKTILQRSFCTK